MLSAYLCDGGERERDLETAREEGEAEEGREPSNRVAALLPYYDGILSPGDLEFRTGRTKKMLPRIESGKPLIRMRSIRKTCEQEWELALRTS